MFLQNLRNPEARPRIISDNGPRGCKLLFLALRNVSKKWNTVLCRFCLT
jgi:hypothetical protein